MISLNRSTSLCYVAHRSRIFLSVISTDDQVTRLFSCSRKCSCLRDHVTPSLITWMICSHMSSNRPVREPPTETCTLQAKAPIAFPDLGKFLSASLTSEQNQPPVRLFLKHVEDCPLANTLDIASFGLEYENLPHEEAR